MIPLGILASAGGVALPSYELIATVTPNGNNDAIDFNSIPSTWTHLELRIVGRSNRAATTDWLGIRFNGDSGANYTYHQLDGNGSSVSSNGASSANTSIGVQFTDIRIPANSFTASAHAAYVLQILDYKSTTKNKTLRGFGGQHGSTNNIKLFSGARLNTAAITSINLFLGGFGNWTTSSRVSLYGIRG